MNIYLPILFNGVINCPLTHFHSGSSDEDSSWCTLYVDIYFVIITFTEFLLHLRKLLKSALGIIRGKTSDLQTRKGKFKHVSD